MAMTVETRVKEMNARRLRVWEQGKALLDRATEARRPMTADEMQMYDKICDEISTIDRERDSLLASDEARSEIETVNEAYERASRPVDRSASETDATLRAFRTRGSSTTSISIDLDRRHYGEGGWYEHRGIFGDVGSSGGSLTIPSLVHQSIFQVMNAANVMRQTRATIIRTSHGDPLSIPVGTQGAGTQVATQDTTIAGTDPTLASKVLRAYDAGNLVAVSNNMIADSGVDILNWVSSNIALAVGALEEQWFVSGDGSSKPQGIMNGGATGSGGTIATGGSLLLGPAGREFEKLVDVTYSVNNVYRAGGEWLMHNNTAATVRKIRDGAGGTAGAFVWQPSPTVGMVGGEPDRLLGYPVFTSTNVSSMGSDAKIAAFGDFSRFVIREAGGFNLERSDHVFFAKNQVGLRGVTRVDSVLTDVTAVNYLHQAVT